MYLSRMGEVFLRRNNLYSSQRFSFLFLVFVDKPNVYQELFNNLDTLLPIILQYENLIDNETMFTDALKSYYFNNLTADADTVFIYNPKHNIEIFCSPCNT